MGGKTGVDNGCHSNSWNGIVSLVKVVDSSDEKYIIQ